jgi:hypothetical protein
MELDSKEIQKDLGSGRVIERCEFIYDKFSMNFLGMGKVEEVPRSQIFVWMLHGRFQTNQFNYRAWNYNQSHLWNIGS